MTSQLGARRRPPPGAEPAFGKPAPLRADDVLDVVASDLPSALVPPGCLGRIRSEARSWPAVTEMGFECRLQPKSTGVDFGLCARSSRHEKTRLVHALRDRFPAAIGDPSYRARLLELLADVAGGDPALASRVRNVCFELDLGRAPDAASRPGIFVGLWHPGTEHLPGAPERASAHDAQAVLRRVAARLLERPLPPGTQAQLRRIEASLPPGAYVANLGLLPGRGPGGVRVNVGGAGRATVAGSWLRELSWPGSRELVAQAYELLDGCDADVYLNLDVGAELRPSLGLEVFFHHQPARSRSCHRLLGRLTAAGLCSPAKRAALLAWPGLRPADAPWPEALAGVSALVAPRAMSVVVRTLNHVKLAVRADALEAKAYLAFGHRWVRPDEPAPAREA